MVTNAELQARRETAVPRGVSTMHPRFITRAANAEMWDVEGNRYIDFASGIAVLNTGHNHPKVIEAVKRQMDCFTHTSFQVNPYEAYIALAERLNAIAPTGQPSKAIFVTTGAEAVENAIKIARAHTRRKAVIAFKGGFHGRTMMGMALTGKVQPYKAGFGPFPGDVWHVPFPIDYHGVSEEQSLAALDSLFKADVDPADVAAIIIEPVQGEGGFYQASASFMAALRALCDEHGMLLIADEIQTGFARTGRMFGIEHSGVAPDLMTIAKSMAGAFSSLGSGSNYTVTRATGDFLTGGIKIGDVIRLSGGSLNANNITKNLVVLGVTATVLTVNVLNSGATLTAEGPIASCTVTVQGKKTWVPTSSHTNDYYTFEEFYSDITRSAVYPDLQIGMVDISVPATGNVSADFGLVGLGGVTRSGTQSLTSPTAATTTSVMSSVAGAVYVGTARFSNITTMAVKIDGQVNPGEAVIGSNSVSDVYRGRVKVSGSFSFVYDGETLADPFFNETAQTLILVLADARTDAANTVGITMSRVKFFSADADDGEKQIVRTVNFTAEINGSGGASLANHQTIVSIQDSQAV